MTRAVHRAAAVGVVSWPGVSVFTAQPARKRIVLHGERQVTSLGYRNRRETEHVSMDETIDWPVVLGNLCS